MRSIDELVPPAGVSGDSPEINIPAASDQISVDVQVKQIGDAIAASVNDAIATLSVAFGDASKCATASTQSNFN